MQYKAEKQSLNTILKTLLVTLNTQTEALETLVNSKPNINAIIKSLEAIQTTYLATMNNLRAPNYEHHLTENIALKNQLKTMYAKLTTDLQTLELEQARILTEEQARILTEEQARILAEEQARILAEEQARILAEEQARILAEEQEIKLAEDIIEKIIFFDKFRLLSENFEQLLKKLPEDNNATSYERQLRSDAIEFKQNFERMVYNLMANQDNLTLKQYQTDFIQEANALIHATNHSSLKQAPGFFKICNMMICHFFDWVKSLFTNAQIQVTFKDRMFMHRNMAFHQELEQLKRLVQEDSPATVPSL